MNVAAMIPARYGSKRLPKKNLETFAGTTLLDFAIIRAQQVFENKDIWVNGDHDEFRSIAENRGVNYYPRATELGNDSATSEDFVADFFTHIECTHVIQIHSITPLLNSGEIRRFVDFLIQNEYETVLSGVPESLECVFDSNPVNFSFSEKTNSQDLRPVFRITWPISAWHKETFLAARKSGRAGTYSGKIGFFTVDAVSGIPIKTRKDLDLVNILYELGV